jgi:hypothetical protein
VLPTIACRETGCRYGVVTVVYRPLTMLGSAGYGSIVSSVNVDDRNNNNNNNNVDQNR